MPILLITADTGPFARARCCPLVRCLSHTRYLTGRWSAMHYKTVWISDLHLGIRGCDAPGLLAFLRQTDFERRYLVDEIEAVS